MYVYVYMKICVYVEFYNMQIDKSRLNKKHSLLFLCVCGCVYNIMCMCIICAWHPVPPVRVVAPSAGQQYARRNNFPHVNITPWHTAPE